MAGALVALSTDRTLYHGQLILAERAHVRVTDRRHMVQLLAVVVDLLGSDAPVRFKVTLGQQQLTRQVSMLPLLVGGTTDWLSQSCERAEVAPHQKLGELHTPERRLRPEPPGDVDDQLVELLSVELRGGHLAGPPQRSVVQSICMHNVCRKIVEPLSDG